MGNVIYYQIFCSQSVVIGAIHLLVELTPGEVTDFDWIHHRLNDIAEQVDVGLITVDRWNSTQLQTQLQNDGFEVVLMGQGVASMSSPMKQFKKLVLTGELIHGGNPVLKWCAGNVVAHKDAAGNIKPDKEKSGEKIDMIVAGLMALDSCQRAPKPVKKKYDGNLSFV